MAAKALRISRDTDPPVRHYAARTGWAELTGPSRARWSFGIEDLPLAPVRGPGVECCGVAARRLDPARTTLTATGPDASQMLALLRTYA